MKLQLHRTILFSAFLFACPRLMVSQQAPASEPKVAPSEAESLVNDLASQVQALEQSCRQIAAVFREMSVPSESDSAATRESKLHYQRLAENEERAAAAASRLLATYHSRLAALTRNSSDTSKPRNVLADSAFRR